MTVRGGDTLVEDICTCRHVPLHPWAFREMSSKGFHPTSTWVLTWIINWAGLPTQVLCTRRDRADGSFPEGWGHTIRGVPPHLWGPSLTLCWHQPSFMEWSAVRAAPQEGRDRRLLAGPSLGSSFSDRMLHPRCRREVPLLPLMPQNSTTHTSPVHLDTTTPVMIVDIPLEPVSLLLYWFRLLYIINPATWTCATMSVGH